MGAGWALPQRTAGLVDVLRSTDALGASEVVHNGSVLVQLHGCYPQDPEWSCLAVFLPKWGDGKALPPRCRCRAGGDANVFRRETRVPRESGRGIIRTRHLGQCVHTHRTRGAPDIRASRCRLQSARPHPYIYGRCMSSKDRI